ncbi:adenosine kinase [Zavarzinia compransoris]|uniref:Adenosine kinase n=1 Tax=Zavarzinia compransoris TaxID=1264899 RepID=A0A317E0T4_9PROT|nr:adenosine kinase [Zavarzinia compransoris]PWR20687.1 adenosine kinase [Zavarzinia compransoris]TDP44488.1 sugar/nucleoside kinase (ribokinase family) [Zavarzinia compransoris]
MGVARFDVLGIGNAIVDVLAPADEAFLDREGLVKGSMTLIDAAQAEGLYGRMQAGVEASGGSAANTMAGLAMLGGSAAFIGRVRDDGLGQVFSHDIRAVGVDFATPVAADGPGTARCLVLVTPDAQRTMATYLGACVGLGPDDVDPAQVADAKITYLEGYLWDPANGKAAFRKAIQAAHDAGRRVALSLSDAFCVHRWRAEFLDLVTNGGVDILFANESEIAALFETGDFDAALQATRGLGITAALTRSDKGSVILGGDEVHVIDAVAPERLVDSTGAGDLYAAGFLYGLTRSLGLARAGRLGSLCAAEVLGHYGPRPQVNLAGFVDGRY